MIFTILDVTGELILSKDESGYQAVLDSFPTAEQIIVVTYNISRKQDGLLAALREADASVRVITSIPSRLNWYSHSPAGQYLKRKASEAIELYLEKLAPEEFGPLTSICFCFENHAKIVMTNSVAYIGSANYSEESTANWEIGILVRNPDTLAQISKFVDQIEQRSVRYFGNKMLEYVSPLLAVRQHLIELRDKLSEGFELVEQHEIKDAIEQLKDAIAESDRAWGEAYEESGPIYSRIDANEINKVDEWYEDSLAFYEWNEAARRLYDAENGDIDAGLLQTDNDGNIPDSAFENVIEECRIEYEKYSVIVQDESRDLQMRISVICEQIEDVCKEISDHLNNIDNT